jgi:hypothetical protein
MMKNTVRALLASAALVGALACGFNAHAQEDDLSVDQEQSFISEAGEVHAASCRGGEGFSSAKQAAAFCHRIFDSTPGPNRGKGLIKIIPVVSGPAHGVTQFNVECCN